jgi:HAMP domain-containing protein
MNSNSMPPDNPNSKPHAATGFQKLNPAAEVGASTDTRPIDSPASKPGAAMGSAAEGNGAVGSGRGSAKMRSYKNIFINPRQQFKYAFVFFGGGLFLMAGFLCLFLYTFNQNLNFLAQAYGIDPGVMVSLHHSLSTTAIATIAFSLALSGLMLGAGVIMSHRVFGPMVPIRRLIGELQAGNYSARGKLRKPDEFQDVMNDLNQLAQTLEQRHIEN